MDASDPPEPPLSKGKGGFKGKRTKRLAYQRKKGAKRQKTSPSPPPPRADEDHTQTNQVTEHAAFPAAILEPEQRLNPNEKQQLLIQQSIYLRQGDESILAPHSPITSGRS